MKADGGDGHTDTVTVTIKAAPTPTEEVPGFEAVFANFFALQKPLLKMLRHCRLARSRLPRAEEGKEVIRNGNKKIKKF
jgi:hypothetical protein